MSKLNGIENIDDGDSSGKELVIDDEATTVCTTTLILKNLTEFYATKVLARLVAESTEKKKMMVEEKGTKHCHETGGEEDYLIRKQKKQKQKTDGGGEKKQNTNKKNKEKGTKCGEKDCLIHKQTRKNVIEKQSTNRCHETGGEEDYLIHKQTRQNVIEKQSTNGCHETGGEEDYLIHKQNKQNICDDGEKKQNTNKNNKEKGTKRCYKSGSQGYLTEGEKDSLINKQTRQNVSEKQSANRCHETGIEEDYLIHKQKKQKTGDDGEKKRNTNKKNKEKKPKDKGQDPNIVKFISMGLEPPPDMPQVFKDCIQNLGGTDIKLVIQKFLQITDLRSSQNRFSMPLKQVRNTQFLNEDEERKVNKKEAIEVVFVEPCLKVSKLNLNKWEIGASWSYVLNGAWYKNVVKNNEEDSLKPKAVVQVWSFRAGPDSKLGFAMIKVVDGEDGHVID